MGNRLFVGGLPWAVDDHQLREHFGSYGQIVKAEVVRDRETQRSRGFGFVEYTSSDEAQAAIQALDGTDMEGRSITVSVAKDRGA